MRGKEKLSFFLCLVFGVLFFCLTLPNGCQPQLNCGESPKSSLDQPDTQDLPRIKHRLPGSGEIVDENVPIVFIGGVPRSGTTIMRVIADAHPQIYCGEETRVVPGLVMSRKRYASKIERARLTAAGISQGILDEATRDFILRILTRDSGSLIEKQQVSMLCDKDPFNLMAMSTLKSLFPNAKFLLMIRDGRAVVHSLITRKVSIGGWDLNSYVDTLTKWSQTVKRFVNECDNQQPGNCMKVYYEQLVLQPNKTIRSIAKFLGVPWNDMMLHHQDEMGKSISYSKLERSTDQVAKPINLLGLNSWVGHIPDNILKNIQTYAPMLKTLGYDLSPNPYYGEPDDIVKKNLKLLKEEPEKFQVETYRFEDGRVISGPQIGAEKMKEHQEDVQQGIKDPEYLPEQRFNVREHYKNLPERYPPRRRAKYRLIQHH